MYTDEQRRSHIFDLQTFLRRIQRSQGYAQPLAPDGIFGPETAAAVRNFQRQNGLPVTGTADYDTWTAIYLAYLALLAGDTLPQAVSFFPAGAGATLSAGDRGPSVLVLQLMLGTALPHFARAADRRIRCGHRRRRAARAGRVPAAADRRGRPRNLGGARPVPQQLFRPHAARLAG